MKNAQTSDEISSLAASYVNLTPERLIGLTAKDEGTRRVAADIRSLAASLLRQDETKGIRRILKLAFGR